MLDELDAVLARIRELGVPLNPSSRFARCRRALEHALDGDAVDLRERSQAHRDVHELVTIGRWLLSAPTARILQAVRTVIADPMLPQDSPAETPGRDAQFELFLASQFVAGGLNVRFEEPDILVDVEGSMIGIAAKRPKSASLLLRRMKEARRQLVRQRERIAFGLVALDVSYLSNPEGLVAASMGPLQDEPVAVEMTRIQIPAILDFVQVWAHPQDELRFAAGVLVFAAVTQYLPTEGGVVFSANFHNIILDRNAKPRLAQLRSAAERGWKKIIEAC